MKTTFCEVTNGKCRNWGKFMVGVFDQRELAVPSLIDQRPLVRGRGWGPGHVFVLDLQTGEAATFKMGGSASADLTKHRIWVCPLFEPFLQWLYLQPDPMKIPALVDLPEAPFAYAGYRRPGPNGITLPTLDETEYVDVMDGLREHAESLIGTGDPEAALIAARVSGLVAKIVDYRRRS